MLHVAKRFRTAPRWFSAGPHASTMATTTSMVGDITVKADKERGYAEVSAMVGSHRLSLETGRIATIASGAVFARYGNTSVLVTAVSEPADAPPEDGGTPLQVDYMEKTFATGHIPSTYTRRETSASDKEILASRVIDRTIRPLFPSTFLRDTQVIATLLSYDPTCEPESLSIVAASAALGVSDIPWSGPAAAVRVGWINNAPVLNPSQAQLDKSALSLLYAGREEYTLMIEAGANRLPESDFLIAARYAQDQLKPLLNMQHLLVDAAGKPKMKLKPETYTRDMVLKAVDVMRPHAGPLFGKSGLSKQERAQRQSELTRRALSPLITAFPSFPEDACKEAIDHALKVLIRGNYLDSSQVDTGVTRLPGWSQEFQYVLGSFQDAVRTDGRNSHEIRPLSCETDVLPVVHGSAVFTRGNTQTLCTTTLGPNQSQLITKAVAGTSETKNFFLHYEFPPYSVNETGKIGGTNRRMVGHGALAEKAVAPVMPDDEAYPYAVRVTSDVTASDGSSSMATVCGASLALMDAGVPISSPVAGISIGLVTPPDFKPGDKYVLLTDILGMEDHFGDMDFKVAGTHDGITAVQLDIKLDGVPLEVLAQGVYRARNARTKILDTMNQCISKPRAVMKSDTPRVKEMLIPKLLRSKLIGPSGATLKRISELTGCTIELSDGNDMAAVFAPSESAMKATEELIVEALGMNPLASIMQPVTKDKFGVGQDVTAKVSHITQFGAVVELDSEGSKGFIPVNELRHERTHRVEDVLKVGDSIDVRVIDIDVVGRVKVSRKIRMPAPAPSPPQPSSSSSQESGSVKARYQPRKPSGPPDEKKSQAQPRKQQGGSENGESKGKKPVSLKKSDTKPQDSSETKP